MQKIEKSTFTFDLDAAAVDSFYSKMDEEVLGVKMMQGAKLAIEHFTALVDHAPEFAEGYNARATAYFQNGQYGPSLEDIRQTLMLNPRHFGAMSGLALILEELGRPPGGELLGHLAVVLLLELQLVGLLLEVVVGHGLDGFIRKLIAESKHPVDQTVFRLDKGLTAGTVLGLLVALAEPAAAQRDVDTGRLALEGPDDQLAVLQKVETGPVHAIQRVIEQRREIRGVRHPVGLVVGPRDERPVAVGDELRGGPEAGASEDASEDASQDGGEDAGSDAQ